MCHRNGRPLLPQLVRISDHLRSEGPSLPRRGPGRYPLVIDPIVCKKYLTKVLMDEGSGLNILYVDTLNAMRIPRSELRLVSSPFHGVIPGTQAYSLEQIDLPVTFGDRANFHSEVLTFEVVDFLGS